MKTWLVGAVVVAMVAVGAPSLSEAKRVGSGKSTGMQRDMPARTAPDAPAGKPAAPAQSATPGAPAAGAVPAAAPKRNWMGPIAGLAAGLGIAALMSHLGMGAAFGNFIMMALLGVAAVVLVMFLVRRFGRNNNMQRSALAGAGGGAAGGAGGSGGVAGAGGQVAWPQANSTAQPVAAAEPVALPAADAAPVMAARTAPAAFVPAAFDSEGFARTAKMIFIRMQSANDTADLDDLRSFTTPEMFASLRLDLQDRGPQAQVTDVLKVESTVLDVSQEATQQVVSVRFTGQVVEEKGAKPVDFNEVWHLVKPLDDSRSWAIAGIEQAH